MFVIAFLFDILFADMQTPDRSQILRELKNHLLFLKDAGYTEIPIESELLPKNISTPNSDKANIIEMIKK